MAFPTDKELEAANAQFGPLDGGLIRLGRLQGAIEKFLAGDYPNPRQHRPGKCQHGTFYLESCEACNDEYLEAALVASKK